MMPASAAFNGFPCFRPRGCRNVFAFSGKAFVTDSPHMNSKREEIASRLAVARECSGISPEAAAAAAGVDAATLESWESGAADIPASALTSLAAILKTDLTELLTGQPPKMHIFAVTRAGQGERVARREDYQYLALAGNFAGRKVELFEVTVPPETESQGSHANTHPNHEVSYVLAGKLRVNIHGNTIDLLPGDSIYFDASYAHSMQALGGEPARFLAIII
jgi:quercetin dioxygenase-like cupin family protein/DNA-binding transcriptional regulator YiaG